VVGEEEAVTIEEATIKSHRDENLPRKQMGELHLGVWIPWAVQTFSLRGYLLCTHCAMYGYPKSTLYLPNLEVVICLPF